MNPKTVRVTYLRQIADQAAELGVDTVAWLAISDLKQDDLADASAVVAVEKFGELITRAVSLSRETGFGVLAGRRLLTATHGVLGMAAFCLHPNGGYQYSYPRGKWKSGGLV